MLVQHFACDFSSRYFGVSAWTARTPESVFSAGPTRWRRFEWVNDSLQDSGRVRQQLIDSVHQLRHCLFTFELRLNQKEVEIAFGIAFTFNRIQLKGEL